jgi:hypothetical protein
MEDNNKIVKPAEDKPQEAKAKKARKPFVWTEARRAAFDKCRKAREGKVKIIQMTSAEAKAKAKKELEDASELVKSTKRLKEILDLLEKKSEDKPVVAPVVQPPPQAEKKVVPPLRKPEPIEEEEEEEYEEEAPKQHFRYQSNTRSLGVPTAPSQPVNRQNSMNRNPYKTTHSYFDNPPQKPNDGPPLLFL